MGHWQLTRVMGNLVEALGHFLIRKTLIRP
jgi:hypothetical protein